MTMLGQIECWNVKHKNQRQEHANQKQKYKMRMM